MDLGDLGIHISGGPGLDLHPGIGNGDLTLANIHLRIPLNSGNVITPSKYPPLVWAASLES